MKSRVLFFTLFIVANNLFSQIILQDSLAVFRGVYEGASVFSDIDSDGDQDFFLTGKDSSDTYISILYINNGLGNFFEDTSQTFEGVYDGAVICFDYDNDFDEDILLTGRNNNEINISKLYQNDGLGNFVEVENTPFEGVHWSEVDYADVDSDNDLDVLISGRNNNDDASTILYINSGNGTFTISQDSILIDVKESSNAFADIDNDGDQDLLITGSGFQPYNSNLYFNDGLGNFSLDSNFVGVNVWGGAVLFFDKDNDGDQDLIITGRSTSSHSTRLYENDGLGTYSYVYNQPFVNVYWSSIAFSDIDSDGDLDLVVKGIDGVDLATNLYLNDGSGDYNLYSDIFLISSLHTGVVDFCDVDNDNDDDLLVMGVNSNGEKVSKLYENQSSLVSINVDLNYVSNSVNGVCNGMLSVSAEGGYAPYEYHWSNALEGDTLDDLCPGYYELTVSDIYNYQTYHQFEIQIEFEEEINFEDTLYQFVDTCLFESSASIDSVSIQDYVLLENGSVILTWVFYHGMNADTLNLISEFEGYGNHLVFLEQNCFTRNPNTLLFWGNVNIQQPENIEYALISKLNVYPNPTSGDLYIDFDGGFDEDFTVEVYKVDGQQLLISKKKRINISFYPQGMYFLKINTHNENYTFKIFKTR